MPLIINILAVSQYVEQLTHTMWNSWLTLCATTVPHNVSQLVKRKKQQKHLYTYTNKRTRYC